MTTGTILDKIMEKKRIELREVKRRVPLDKLHARIERLSPPLNFSGALWGDRVRLIAEVKQASPSKGVMSTNFEPVGLATCYAQNGAAAISVLTERDHFRGSLENLRDVKEAVGPMGLPVMRKDFIYDDYQIYESRAYGADAILLIVAILEPATLKQLLVKAQELWLQVLVEIHNRVELETALEAGAEIIGINHRDLRTFDVDASLTSRLRPFIPRNVQVVSESGISTSEHVEKLQREGANAVLVGEALVTAEDTSVKVRELAGFKLEAL